MKLLIMYAKEFSYSVANKKVDDADELVGPNHFENVLMAFIHVEEKDEMNQTIEQQLIKHLKWAAGRNNTTNIILHSFTHLSDSNAKPQFIRSLFDIVQQRMTRSDYIVNKAPFGYFLDISIESPGYADSRVFKSF